MARLHALLGNFQVHASAIGQLFAGAFENFFEFALGFGEFLLMEERKCFVVELELSLDTRVNQLDTAALGDALELKVFFSIGWLYGAWDSWNAQDFPNWACAPLACRECSRATIARQRKAGVTSLIHKELSRSRKG